MKLYRPVGISELELIKQSGMTKFPPRLPDQPIFYPVLNRKYACQIAREWNTKSAPGYAGFVTEFDVDDDYISKFEVKTVGAFVHTELWIPAEELDEFNRHIIGEIKVIESYYGENYKGSKTEIPVMEKAKLEEPVIEVRNIEIPNIEVTNIEINELEVAKSEIYSLQAIEVLKNGDFRSLKSEKWLMYLALTAERNINLERLYSLEETRSNYVLNYVEKTLKLLSELDLNKYQKHILEETLKWSEVAKSGLKHQRDQWIKNGYNLFAHNIGSAQIYQEQSNEADLDIKRIVYDLILTHGLIGQYIRGEIPLMDNKPLYQLVIDNKLSAKELKEILMALNFCIIAAVDEYIWLDIKLQVEVVIDFVISGRFDKQYEFKDRLIRLRQVSAKNGENFEAEFARVLSDSRLILRIARLLDKADLWYVEAATYDFSFEEFVKVFLIIDHEVKVEEIKHISFERFMKGLYYQHEGKKRVNIYKKRIIEKYLSEISMEDILEGRFKENPHVVHEIAFLEDVEDTMFLTSIFCSREQTDRLLY